LKGSLIKEKKLLQGIRQDFKGQEKRRLRKSVHRKKKTVKRGGSRQKWWEWKRVSWALSFRSKGLGLGGLGKKRNPELIPR